MTDAGVITISAEIDCDLGWVPTFGQQPGVDHNGSPPVAAMAVHDDGTGSALYVAGGFIDAGGVLANGIARWDGSAWAPLSSGMNFAVNAMAVFDDGSGSGPALYAAGGLHERGR